MEHTIKLPFGYEDRNGVVHRDVTFSRRLTAGDIILLDNDPQAQNPTQYADLVRRRFITKFGTLKIPVDLKVLLELNSIDRDDLQTGADEFVQLSRDGRSSEFLPDGRVKLFFGFEIDETIYRTVEFGRLNTGRDEVAADAVGPRGVARECFLLGRMITKLKGDDGAELEGPFELDRFSDLDAEDLNLLRIGARLAEAMFRQTRKDLSRERTGSDGSVDDAGDRDDGSGGAGSSDNAGE